jgi:hypothetical protein
MFDECYVGKEEQDPEKIFSKVMSKSFILEIKKLGKIEAIVSELIQHETFSDLSKHNEKFQSEHEREDEILFSLRGNLRHIQDMLAEILEVSEAE